jgi:hypothetical protein
MPIDPTSIAALCILAACIVLAIERIGDWFDRRHHDIEQPLGKERIGR